MSVNTKVNGQLVPSAGLYKVSVPIQNGDIYSLEEKEVGCWTDGKPLYQKTFVTEKTNIAGNSTINVNSEFSQLNVDEVISYKDKLTYTISGGTGQYYSDDIARFRKAGSDYDITLTIGNATLATLIIEWTIQYTKTTDVAGSGIYVPSGDKAVHYSTDEEVIGTWLGETLYRKVIPITQDWNFTANTWVKSNIPKGNIKAMINGRIEIFYQDTYSLHFVQLGIIDNMIAGNSFRQFSAAANGANLILEYTKTS